MVRKKSNRIIPVAGSIKASSKSSKVIEPIGYDMKTAKMYSYTLSLLGYVTAH